MATALSLRRPDGRLLRDVGTTYAGFFINAALGFLTTRLVAQHLGPEAFGVTNLANLFMAIIGGLGEPGIGIALVRLVSQPGMTAAAADALVVTAIRLKLLFVGLLCAAAYVAMPWITGGFMHRPELTGLFRWCLIGGGLLSLAAFAGALFQIRGAFRDSATTIVIAGMARMVAVVALLWGDCLTLETAVAALILMNVVQCGVSVVALRSMLAALPWRCVSGQNVGKLIHYTRCLVVWLALGTFVPRADALLLTHYIKTNQVLGYYFAASQFALLVPMLTQSINKVLLPRISSLHTGRAMRSALRSHLLAGLIVVVPLVVLALVAEPLVRLVFGTEFSPAAPLLRILLLAVGVELALNPLSQFWHALNRPGMLSVLNVVRLGVLVLTASVAIPRFGAAGAAWAAVCGAVLPLTAQAVILWITVGRLCAQETAGEIGG